MNLNKLTEKAQEAFLLSVSLWFKIRDHRAIGSPVGMRSNRGRSGNAVISSDWPNRP